MSLFGPCMSVFNLRMRVCSSINLFVQLEKSPFNIMSRIFERSCGRKFWTLYVLYMINVFFKLLFAASFSDIYIYIYA